MQEWTKKISAGSLPILLGTGAALFYHSISETGGSAFLVFFAALFLVVLTQTIWRYRKQRWLQILGISLLTVVSLYVLWQCIGSPERRTLFLAGLVRWIEYAPILLVIPLSFLPRTFWGRVGAAVAVLAVLLVVAWTERMMGKTGVLILMIYLLGVLAELVSRTTYREREFEPKRYLQLVGCLMPAFLALILLISTFKIPEKPMEWRWVKDAWYAVQDAGRNLSSRILWYFDREDDEFAIRFSGYDEVVSMDGEVRTTRREEMSVKSKQVANKVLYLAGNYKNTYTGDGWVDSTSSLPYEERFTDGYVDVLEILYAMERAEIEFEDLLRNRHIELNYRDLRTVTLFQPAYSWQLTPDEIRGEELPYESRYASLQWEEEPRWNYGYRIRYLDLNLGNELFREFAGEQGLYRYKTEVEETEEEQDAYQKMIKVWRYQLNGMDMDLPETRQEMENLLAERAERIKKEYTMLPRALPERVYDLAEEIVAVAEGSDYEKLLAIEAFLNQYTYTTTPMRPPLDENGEPAQVDVVDWFLFESQEGYCTHFAAAAAVLARCVGIPTRYVQGYAVDLRGDKMGEEYSIYGGDAHAWAEAYLEGVGWVPIEATPSYWNGRYQYWKTQADKLAEAEKEKAENGDYAGMGSGMTGLPAMPDIPIPEPVVPELPEMNEGQVTEEKSQAWLYVLAASGGLFALILLIGGVYLLAMHLMLRRRYRRSSDADRIRINMSQILLMLAADGIPQAAGETLTAYEQRLAVDWDGAFLYQSRLREVWNSYQRHRYGGAESTEEEQAALRSLRDDMLARERKKMGLLKFLRFYVEMGRLEL